MDIRQLECFVAVADVGSFTKAAWMLGVHQPALSRQVRGLEVELRQTLFHRNGRGVNLTEPGKRFLAHCRGILVQVERARQEMEGSRGEPSGEVALGLPHSIARIVTFDFVEEFKARFPRGKLRICEGLTGHLQEWLLAGRIDLALLHDPVPMPMLETIPLREEALHLVGARSAVNLPPTVPLREIAGIPLVLLSRPHPIRMLIESQLANLALKPTIVHEIDAIAGILDVVERSASHAVVSLNALQHRDGDRRFSTRRIVAPELTSMLTLGMSSERPITVLARETATLLQTLIRKMLPGKSGGYVRLA